MIEPEDGRLLPWADPDGRPAYLVAEKGSILNRLADNVEHMQISMGTELLAHAAEILALPEVSDVELRYLTQRLTEALADALRVAECRGDRLGLDSP